MLKKYCDFWCIFEGDNDWNVAEIEFDSKLEDEVFTDMVGVVYAEHAQIIADYVSVGKFAALPIHGRNNEKFEVVQYQSEPYVFNSNTFKGDVNKMDATEIKNGDLVADALRWYKLPITNMWYYPSAYQTLVQLKKIVESDFPMSPISNDNPLSISQFRPT